MYAIVATGGKQYRVKEGEKLRVEKLPGEVGDTIELVKFYWSVKAKTLKLAHPS